MQGWRRFALVMGCLLLGAWAALRLVPSRPLPSVPLASSAAREAAEEAEGEPTYVGVQACAACHADQYRSYLSTAHSRALADIDPQAEPADAEFDHPFSGRSFQAYRAGGAFRHRQWLTNVDAEAFVQDYSVKYLIGSGRHTRSYLIEDDGFLIESPLTWYASRKAWGMSPGYDRPGHLGFERAADLGCVVCHVGRAETIDGSLSRIAIHEQAIGCESCHGPGSAHVARREQKGGVRPAEEAIVHPGRLSRELSEAICSQCHLRSDATVFVRGRSAADFRPGRELSEYRIDYRQDRPESQMKVVGHVEQMRLSRCYQQSDGLTCTTCHDPHAAAAPERPTSKYRDACLQCHTTSACGLELGERAKIQPADNCLACHMPQVSTNIPHVAFTHHRIGVHSSEPREPAAGEGLGDLTPLADVSRLSDIDRDRCLGLAYLEFSQTQSGPQAQRHYRNRAVELLESVRNRGLRDAHVDSGLARVYWSDSPRQAAAAALAALEDRPLPPSEHVNALFVLAGLHFRARQWPAAGAALEQLTHLRRHPVDWMLLGLCQAEAGDDAAAIASLRRAAEINPYQRDVHEQLARLYVRQGQIQLAERHRRLVQELENREQELTKTK